MLIVESEVEGLNSDRLLEEGLPSDRTEKSKGAPSSQE